MGFIFFFNIFTVFYFCNKFSIWRNATGSINHLWVIVYAMNIFTKYFVSNFQNKSRTSEDESQDGWDRSVSNSGAVLQLRQWIDNYEEAVTNHYSPELRARISSIKVNGIHSDLKAGNLHSLTSGATKCRVSQLGPGVRVRYL